MASLNKVMLIGNLGADPELRYTQSQTAVANFNIATTEVRNSPDGQRQENTEWHRIVVWNRVAENCAKYLTKGRTVYVEGRLQTRAWEDKTGAKRYTTEVVAQTVQFLNSQTGSGAAAGMGPGDQMGGGRDDHMGGSPFGGNAPGGAPDFGGQPSQSPGAAFGQQGQHGMGGGGGQAPAGGGADIDDIPF